MYGPIEKIRIAESLKRVIKRNRKGEIKRDKGFLEWGARHQSPRGGTTARWKCQAVQNIIGKPGNGTGNGREAGQGT